MTGNLLVVSGASRGLGRAIALALARSQKLVEGPTSALLLARDSEGLQQTRRSIIEILNSSAIVKDRSKESTAANRWHIAAHSVDLANLQSLESTVIPLLRESAERSTIQQARTFHAMASEVTGHDSTRLSRAIFVNCAGSTGAIGRNPTSLQGIQEAIDLNLTSKIWLTSQFVDVCQTATIPASPTHSLPEQPAFEEITVVNMSSMCAIKPTPTMALYCATSAGREMYHTVLAKDVDTKSRQKSKTRILNYAPGSCDTDMQALLRSHKDLDPAVQAYCQSLVLPRDQPRRGGGGLVDCNETARELVRLILEEGESHSWQTGDRVEFVDMDTYKY